jgi:outer membrane protein
MRNSLTAIAILSCCLAAHAQRPEAKEIPSAPAVQFTLAQASAAPVSATMQSNTTAAMDAASDAPSLTREQAEHLALKNNPHITVARLTALADRQIVRETRSAELPSLTGTGTLVGAEQASRIGSGTITASRLLNHGGAGVGFTQLLTDFGRTQHLIAASSLQAKAAEQNAEATREAIVFATDLAFYNALEAQATLAVAKSTQTQRQSVTDQVNALTASKLRSTLDQSFADVNLSQAQLMVLDAQSQYDAATANLDEVLGTADDRRYNLIDDATTPAPVAASADAVLTLALSQRPDLRALELAHQADLWFSRAQHEQLLPTLNAQSIVGITPFGSATYFSPDWYGAADINLSIPIFEGFKFRAQAQEADLRAKASSEQSRALTDRIARDVRVAWLEAATAQQRMSVTAQLLKQANMGLDLAKTRYQLGLSSIVELTQAQLQQTQAQIDQANARLEYEADLARLRFESGSQP